MSRIEAIWHSLGISADLVRQRRLAMFEEAKELTDVVSPERRFQMSPETAVAWHHLHCAAREDGVQIHLISAFRSYDYQVGLIEKKLEKGQKIEEILAILAPPGCSEHHTGQALDLGTPDCPPVSEAFETTAAFRWLVGHASSYGFSLSYPRNNPCGYIYEPWHWKHGITAGN